MRGQYGWHGKTRTRTETEGKRLKRPLAYITAAWCGEPDTDTEMGARYSRMAYEAGFSLCAPTLGKLTKLLSGNFTFFNRSIFRQF